MNPRPTVPEVGQIVGSKQGAAGGAASMQRKTLKGGGKDVTYAQLKTWLEGDWAARQAVSIANAMVLSLIGEYEHEDEGVREFVRGAIGYMRRSWRAAQNALLEARWFGAAAGELVWETAPGGPWAGRWMLKTIVPIDLEALANGGMKQADGLEQTEFVLNKGKMDALTIPGEKVVHWAYDSAADPYGRGLAQGLVTLLEGRLDAMVYWIAGLERLGLPLIIEIVPPGTFQDETGNAKSFIQEAEDAWKRTQGGSIVLRVAADEEGKLPKISGLDLGGWTDEFKTFFGYTERSLFLGNGVPPLLVMESEHGTRAQAETQGDVSGLIFEPLAREFSHAVLVDQIVQPLVFYNFGEQESYGEFPVAKQMDAKSLTGIMESLYRIGAFGEMPEAFYRRVREQPGLGWLPSWEEVEKTGRVAIPAGVR